MTLFFRHCAHVIICESRSSANTSNNTWNYSRSNQRRARYQREIRSRCAADKVYVFRLCFLTLNSFCFINQLYSPLNYQILLEGILLKNKQATSLITRYLYPIRGLMQINKLFLCLILRQSVAARGITFTVQTINYTLMCVVELR